MKALILLAFAVSGGAIASFLGGFDILLQTLLIFMTIDYITGLLVAGVFKKSKKTVMGALESYWVLKGVIKKFMQLLMVVVAHQLDDIIGVDFIRHAVTIAFISSELLSIIENMGLMGIPIPQALRNAIEILNKNEEKHDSNPDHNNNDNNSNQNLSENHDDDQLPNEGGLKQE